MTIQQLNYYRVICDGLDEKTDKPCRGYINIAARDLTHAAEVLEVNKWVGEIIKHGEIFDSCPGFNALCPAHKGNA